MEFTVRVQDAESGPQVLRPARDLVRAVLEIWDCDDPDDVGALLTSELVTNAICHTAGLLEMRLDVSVSEGIARVTVEDAGPSLPDRRPVDIDAVRKHGLDLVEMLATRWGTDRSERGKIVWFEFPIRCR